MISTADHPHRFAPDTVVAPAGSRVRMTFVNPSDEGHTFTYPPVPPHIVDVGIEIGETKVFEFTMPSTQTRFVCMVHQSEGMIGLLIPS